MRNPAVKSRKSGQQPKPSMTNVDDIVKSTAPTLAVGQVDNLTQNPGDREALSHLSRSPLSLAKSVFQPQREAKSTLANIKLSRRDAVLKSLSQRSDRTKMELCSKEGFRPQPFAEETLQAAIECSVQDASVQAALQTAVLVDSCPRPARRRLTPRRS